MLVLKKAPKTRRMVSCPSKNTGEQSRNAIRTRSNHPFKPGFEYLQGAEKAQNKTLQVVYIARLKALQGLKKAEHPCPAHRLKMRTCRDVF